MRGGLDEVGHRVFVLETSAGHSPAASTLGAEFLSRDRLHVSRGRHGEDQIVVVDEIFDVELAGIYLEARVPGLGELFADGRYFVGDHATQFLVVTENRLEFGNHSTLVGGLALQRLSTQPGESHQLHFKNVVGLNLGKLKRRSHQGRASHGAIGAGSNRSDDLVDQIERLDQAFQNVKPLLGLVETVLRTPGENLYLVFDVSHEGVAQRESARHTFDESDHVYGETRLQGRVFPELVEHDLGIGIALEGDDKASVVTG